MAKQTIPVVFATDDNYVPYCGVAIASLIKNTNENIDYEVYVLYNKLTNLSIYRLESLSTKNVKVKGLCIKENIASLKVLEYNHLTIASAFRLVIPELFSDYEKVLYLDSDIVINVDVAELYNIEIENNILGAAKGYNSEKFGIKYIAENLRIKNENFFNAGILIINIQEFNKQNIKEKCFKLLGERTDLLFMDQCALNINCEGKVHYFSTKWNNEWLPLFDTSIPTESHNNKELDEFAANSIIHYDGTEKPWNYPDRLLSKYFWMYARETEFYEEIIRKAQLLCIKKNYDLVNLVGASRNIAIYGAGNAGQRYVDDILFLQTYSIATWVDRDYESINDRRLPIESVETLYTTDFDCVIIAIENKFISNDVKEMLIKNNVPADKIKQI